jgi:hypothetical protein
MTGSWNQKATNSSPSKKYDKIFITPIKNIRKQSFVLVVINNSSCAVQLEV